MTGTCPSPLRLGAFAENSPIPRLLEPCLFIRCRLHIPIWDGEAYF